MTFVITYRTFRNSDPPLIRALWNSAGLGRGAAEGFGCDALDGLIFGQSYFVPNGLILAFSGQELVGLVHAGVTPPFHASAHNGVICAVIVRPDYRRQGIARELFSRAEAYLEAAGVDAIFAGAANPRDPFYFGLYGGAQSAGFLESDPLAAIVLPKFGYLPCEKHLIFQRDLIQSRDPILVRLMNTRRKTQVAALVPGIHRDWWWCTRKGRVESVDLGLVHKQSQEVLATVTLVGLDYYADKWGKQAVGLIDLHVPETLRRNGYGQTLLYEVGRQVKSDLITVLEMHAAESDVPLVKLLKASQFTQVDAGIVYRKAGS